MLKSCRGLSAIPRGILTSTYPISRVCTLPHSSTIFGTFYIMIDIATTQYVFRRAALHVRSPHGAGHAAGQLVKTQTRRG